MAFFSSFEDLLGGFGGGGHHHHHRGQESDESEEETDTTTFYKLLGVDKKATQDEIKKAYRKQARKLHPDRHPNEKAKYQTLFQALQNAYEILKNPHKRQLYDKYGEKGAKRGHAPFKGGMGGLFEQMFSNSRGGGQQQDTGPKKSPPIKRVITITLEDSYSGNTKIIEIAKSVGKSDGKKAKCARCHGQGRVTVTQRRGPVILQSTQHCSDCGGKGYKLASKNVKVEVNVPIGAKHAETFTVPGVGHEYPDHEPGDLLIQFKMRSHSSFTRQGADLGMTHKLTLREALCGYKLRVKHVSGKNLVITPESDDEIVQPGSLKRVMSMGMPQRYSPHIKGHLYIIMEVEMPKPRTLSNKAINNFRKILPDTLPEKKKNEVGMSDEDEEMKEGSERVNGSKTKGYKKKKKKANTNSSFGANLFSHMNKGKKMDIDETESDTDDESIDYCTAEACSQKPKFTPASAQHEYDDDDTQDNVQCRQM